MIMSSQCQFVDGPMDGDERRVLDVVQEYFFRVEQALLPPEALANVQHKFTVRVRYQRENDHTFRWDPGFVE